MDRKELRDYIREWVYRVASLYESLTKHGKKEESARSK